MKKMRSLLPIFLAALTLIAGAAFVQAAGGDKKFTADLAGVGGSPGSGKATFELNKDGTAMKYKLNVSRVENITMAHIHLGGAGKDGPVIAWLYPSAPPPKTKEGMFEGKLSDGEIKAENLQGELKGKPLSALIEKMEAGEAYVNVHTTAKPGGEIRGQIHK